MNVIFRKEGRLAVQFSLEGKWSLRFKDRKSREVAYCS